MKEEDKRKKPPSHLRGKEATKTFFLFYDYTIVCCVMNVFSVLCFKDVV